MNYEEMSDGEINWKVHHALNKVPEGHATITTCDYCNNWADAGPIIAENKINIEWRDSLKVLPMARGTGGCDSYQADKNVLRAAMICFLKMKGAEI